MSIKPSMVVAAKQIKITLSISFNVAIHYQTLILIIVTGL